MADIEIAISRQFDVNASPETVYEFLADTRLTLDQYPKLDKLVELGDDCWRWELSPTGVKGISHQVIYSVRYSFEQNKGVIAWNPIQAASDNANIRGGFNIFAREGGSRVQLDTDGTLDIPVPRLLASAAKPLVLREFELQIDGFIANLIKVIGK